MRGARKPLPPAVRAWNRREAELKRRYPFLRPRDLTRYMVRSQQGWAHPSVKWRRPDGRPAKGPDWRGLVRRLARL